jgi:competence protein ComEA
MPRRLPPESLSPRALARLRASPGCYVPTELDLEAIRPARTGRPGEAPGDRPGVVAGLDAVQAREALDTTGNGRHARARHPRGWVRLPAAFVGARWQPGRSALLGIVLVVLLAAAIFGLRVARAQSAGGGTVIAPGGGSRAGPSAVTAGAVPVGVSGSAADESQGPTPTSPAGQAPRVQPSAAAGVVVVHVVGRVKHPGVRRLPPGSRVTDAVEAAGGVSTKADLSLLNLARVLVDGEQVRVPAAGESVVPVPTAGAGGATSGGGGSGTKGSGAPVSLNTADLAALDSLPGVGPVLAQRIVDWRSSHGRFTSVDELGEVSGIGEKLLAQLSPLVTL